MPFQTVSISMPFRYFSAISLAAFTVTTLVTVFLLAAPAQSRVAWELRQTITPDASPLDVAASIDGSRIFVLTKGGKVQIFDPNGELIASIPVSPKMERITAIGLQQVGIPEKIFLSGKEAGIVQELTLEFAVPIDISGAPVLGPADAPVKIVEFSDFLCPHCATVKFLTEEIQRLYPQQVKVVFKNFPLSRDGLSIPAALAAMAAHRQGKFWEFHARLFKAQRELNPKKIRVIAQDLQLDLTRFDQDIKSQELAKYLEKDIRDGQMAGVRGTPTIFINGMLLKQRDLATMQLMVNQALQRNQSR